MQQRRSGANGSRQSEVNNEYPHNSGYDLDKHGFRSNSKSLIEGHITSHERARVEEELGQDELSQMIHVGIRKTSRRL